MKSIGVVRKIDPLGRYVLPKELRDALGLTEGTPLEVYTEGELIILKKYQPGCTFCDGLDNLVEFGGEQICGNCRDEIRKRL